MEGKSVTHCKAKYMLFEKCKCSFKKMHVYFSLLESIIKRGLD